ncbi:glycosyltransferase family 2 protein [Streptosporangium sp. KLBMP 9127]|nr:glycosyltransferase family 2 protein [Streptosporangium sp. KLBMP 9127]
MAEVAVIIPNYNYAKSLRRCLTAVFAQTLPPGEVIVVDDASTDLSVDVAREFPCTVLTTPVNRGPSAARNRGVAGSTAEILFFLDSDIELEPDAIENAVEILRANPGMGCVHGIYAKEPMFEAGAVEYYRVLHNHHARKRAVGPSGALFALGAMRREVFEEIGEFDEALRNSEDMEYGARLARRYPSSLTDRIAGRHDDDKSLRVILRKQFQRSQTILPMMARQPQGRTVRLNRTSGVACAGLTVLSAPLAAVSPVLGLLPVLFLLLFAVHDPALARLVMREKGAVFFLQFTAINFLVQLALLAGVAAGLAPRRRGPGALPAGAGVTGGSPR